MTSFKNGLSPSHSVGLDSRPRELLLHPRDVVHGVEYRADHRQHLHHPHQGGQEAVVVSGEQQKYGVALEPEPDKGGDVTDQQEPGNVSGGAPPVALRGAHLQRPADPEGEHDAFIRRVGCVSLLLL